MKTKLIMGLMLGGLIQFSSPSIQAQSKMYVDVNLGYAFTPANAGYFEERNSIGSDFNNAITTLTNVPYSFGAGFNFGASFGYKLNKHVALELGVAHNLGKKIKTTSKSEYTDYTFPGVAYYRLYEEESYCNLTSITPSFVMSGGFEKWDPYAKIGMVLGFGKAHSTGNRQVQQDGVPDYNESTTYEATGGMALGFSGSIGLNYNLNENLGIFGEFNLTHLNYKYKKITTTAYTVNGVDELPNLSEDSRVTELVDEYSYGNVIHNPDTPSTALAVPFVFSNYGIKAGLRINL